MIYINNIRMGYWITFYIKWTGHESHFIIRKTLIGSAIQTKKISIACSRTDCSKQYPVLLRGLFHHSTEHNPNNCTNCAETHLASLTRSKVKVGGRGDEDTLYKLKRIAIQPYCKRLVWLARWERDEMTQRAVHSRQYLALPAVTQVQFRPVDSLARVASARLPYQ